MVGGKRGKSDSNGAGGVCVLNSTQSLEVKRGPQQPIGRREEGFLSNYTWQADKLLCRRVRVVKWSFVQLTISFETPL